jgi:hypothetical protein
LAENFEVENVQLLTMILWENFLSAEFFLSGNGPLKPVFHLRIFSREANFSFVFGLSTGTNWIKTKENFASREKIRKWKTGLTLTARRMAFARNFNLLNSSPSRSFLVYTKASFPSYISGDTLYFVFQSDSTNTDWGWKFTVTGGQLGR